jgi:16S rRNA (guanine527-N7)-methyltransferase
LKYLSDQADEAFQCRIIEGAKQLGITVSSDQAGLMGLHARELMAWNKKINLTAIKKPLEIAEKHFIDSIAGGSFMGNEKYLADLGAGGGFPSIPIKIMKPSLKVVMIDASRKKINFLKHVIRSLNLKHIDAVHSRVEDLHEHPDYKNKFDAVISRAFTDLSGFADLAIPLLNHEGVIYAMKGKNADQEISVDVQKNFDLHARHYCLPFEKSGRAMIRLSVRRGGPCHC